mgnify:CR=1 FL=1|jgi:Glycosyltransferases involved in cell wall biogenesis
MLASVCTLVYNHECFVEESLNSTLNQRCNFEFEVVASEDYSSDRSREKLLLIKRQVNNRLALLLPEHNLGMIENFYTTLDRCTGSYIAFCEGDDFWNSPDKLQKQVEILEANPEVGLVFSNFNIKEKHRTIKGALKAKPICIEKPEELLVSNPIATCTVVCRRDLLNEARAFIGERRFAMGDYPFWLYIAQKSKLAYLDEPLATYRIVGGSATNQGYHKQLTFLESLQEVKEFFMEHFTYSEPVRHRVKLEYLQKKLMLCFLTNKKEELYKCAQRLELLKGKLTLRERVYTTMGRSWLLSFPIKLYHNTYHRLRRG